MITFAKGVTQRLPAAGRAVASSRVAEPFWTTPGRQPFRHGPTYAGHAACCAAGLANLDIIEREGLADEGQGARGRSLRRSRAAADHPLVAEVRGGTGLLAAVELSPDFLQTVQGAPWKTYVAIREAGFSSVRSSRRSRSRLR